MGSLVMLMCFAGGSTPPSRGAGTPVNRKAVDESGTLLAGCIAEIYCWNVAYVELLWVDERVPDPAVFSRCAAPGPQTSCRWASFFFR